MSEHERYAEELAMYALNALAEEERAHVKQHLLECPACRLELEQLRGDTALLALSAAGPRPPQRARKRLLDAVAQEAMPSPAFAQQARKGGARSVVDARAVDTQGHWSWWGWMGWAAAAAMLLISVSLLLQNHSLRRDLLRAEHESADYMLGLQELQKVTAPLLQPEAQRVTLVSVKTPPQPQGKAFYLKDRSSLVFLANNLPALAPQKAYELWLIPRSGAPVPAGVFKPDAHGSASVVNPPLPAGIEAKAFAITIENEAGANTPTMPIVMMGQGE